MPKFDAQMVRTESVFPDKAGPVEGQHDLKIIEEPSLFEALETAIYEEGDDHIITAIYPTGGRVEGGWLLVYGDPRFGDPEGPYPTIDEALAHVFDGAEFRIAIPYDKEER